MLKDIKTSETFGYLSCEINIKSTYSECFGFIKGVSEG
jgi:hypothetical protein